MNDNAMRGDATANMLQGMLRRWLRDIPEEQARGLLAEIASVGNEIGKYLATLTDSDSTVGPGYDSGSIGNREVNASAGTDTPVAETALPTGESETVGSGLETAMAGDDGGDWSVTIPTV